MKKTATKITALFFVLLFIFSNFATAVYATDESAGTDETIGHALVLTCDHLSVTKGKTILAVTSK